MGFLAASPDGDIGRVKATSEKWGIHAQVAFATGDIMALLQASGVPFTAFVDKHGTILATATGERSPKFFEARIQELLKASNPP